MLASLIPILHVSRRGRKLLRVSHAYADLKTLDPKLYNDNLHLPNTLKIINTTIGRGRIPQWLNLDLVQLRDIPDMGALRNRPLVVYIHGGGWTVGDKM